MKVHPTQRDRLGAIAPYGVRFAVAVWAAADGHRLRYSDSITPQKAITQIAISTNVLPTPSAMCGTRTAMIKTYNIMIKIRN